MKIKFGSLVVAGSGKIGGHVAAKNRGGAYLRTKVTPLNPNTAAQAGARSLLASLSTAWAGLTDEQRKSWNDAVASFATTDIFGDLRNPSGINLYVKLNANLSNSNQTLLVVAPEKMDIPFAPITAVLFDLSLQTMTFSYAGGVLDGVIGRIQATAPMSQGVSFVKSQLRTIANGDLDSDTGATYAAYIAKFGVPTAGSNIVVSFAPIVATGQQGVPQSIKAIVQA
jgi:hypothetical protein